MRSKLFSLVVLFLFFAVPAFAQQTAPKIVLGSGNITLNPQTAPSFERFREVGASFAPTINYFLTDSDGGYMGGGSNGATTRFVVRRNINKKFFGPGVTGMLYLDADNNVNTGRKSSRITGRPSDPFDATIGIEYQVDLTNAGSGQAALYDAYGDFVAMIPAWSDLVSVTVDVPVTLVNSDGNMNALAVVNDDSGQDWIPDKGFLPIWEFNLAILPLSSPTAEFSLVFTDQKEALLLVNNFAKLKLFGVVAQLNGKSVELEKVGDQLFSDSELYRIPDFGARLTTGLFSPNTLSFGVLTERGFFSRSTTYIAAPPLNAPHTSPPARN